MSTFDVATNPVPVTLPVATEKAPKPRRPKLSETWWRHLVGIVAVVFALFPIWFVVSAAFNADQSVSGTGFVPLHWTLGNFRTLLENKIVNPSTGSPNYSPFLHWFGNTLMVAGISSFFTVFIAALAAYAFSRFRFKGRRVGMLFLLLVQMFPGLLLVIALYLIIRSTGSIFPFMGLNTYVALVLIYLGGAMGANTWLMKGFFDTIPKELDESARVDGATPAQIFWGVVMPLALPILAVIGLLSFIGALNEYAIASAIMQTPDHYTLPVGMNQFISGNYGQYWGYFAAGCLVAAVPAALLFSWLQKYIVSGLSQGAVKG